MKVYIKGTAFANYQVDDTWVETEDEIVETPIGMQLLSYTQTQEYQQRIENLYKKES